MNLSLSQKSFSYLTFLTYVCFSKFWKFVVIGHFFIKSSFSKMFEGVFTRFTSLFGLFWALFMIWCYHQKISKIFNFQNSTYYSLDHRAPGSWRLFWSIWIIWSWFYQKTLLLLLFCRIGRFTYILSILYKKNTLHPKLQENGIELNFWALNDSFLTSHT